MISRDVISVLKTGIKIFALLPGSTVYLIVYNSEQSEVPIVWRRRLLMLAEIVWFPRISLRASTYRYSCLM